MNIHVYDTHVHTHVHTQAGEYIHFDVLVNGENVEHVKKFADQYLASLGVKSEQVKQGRCNFCHSEIANPEVRDDIAKQGHSIIRL